MKERETISAERWADWRLRDEGGGDPERRRALREQHYPTRDRIFQNSGLRGGEVVLDVGTGDGLIAFAVLPRVGESGRVIFNDISRELLDHCRSVAREREFLDRCEFLECPAEDLSRLAAASVDIVTSRASVTWVPDKHRAFREFWRVLKPGGRISFCEPIFRFSGRWDTDGRLLGYDMGPVADLAPRVFDVFRHLVPPDSHASRNFDERDLLSLAEEAGFAKITVELEARVNHRFVYPDWAMFRYASIWTGDREAAIRRALGPEEAERFLGYLREQVETQPVTQRSAAAYLWAEKAPG